jgi:hypothetical protein
MPRNGVALLGKQFDWFLCFRLPLSLSLLFFPFRAFLDRWDRVAPTKTIPSTLSVRLDKLFLSVSTEKEEIYFHMKELGTFLFCILFASSSLTIGHLHIKITF